MLEGYTWTTCICIFKQAFLTNIKTSNRPCLEMTRRTCGLDPDYQTWTTWIFWGCPGEWPLPGSIPASDGALCQKRTVKNKTHKGLHNILYKKWSWAQYICQKGTLNKNIVACRILWNHLIFCKRGSIFMNVELLKKSLRNISWNSLFM